MASSQEDIVVSGIAGKFPKSENVEELKENLFKGVECYDDVPWKFEEEFFPKKMGRLRTFEEFDPGFFGILPKEADKMCPISRMLLEASYEAIIDAGVNPSTLKNTSCGIYIASEGSESSEAKTNHALKRSVAPGIFTILQCLQSGRISSWLGTTGPNYVVTSGCSGSMTALNSAFRDIRNGVCDAALVGAAHMMQLPFMTYLLASGTFLSDDDHICSYGKSASGFIRSEAVAMIFLQKAKDAKRVYSTIVGVRTGSDGHNENGFAQTLSEGQVLLFENFYKEFRFDRLKVNYIEGHGAGTLVGDVQECRAIEEFFTKGRKQHIGLGSVKSIIGHCEDAATLVGIIKVLIAMETQCLPATINCEEPNPNIPALSNGSIKVSCTNTAFDEKYAGVNSFGLGGSVGHAVLMRNEKTKNKNSCKSEFPILVLSSGRTPEAVEVMVDQATAGEVDHEFVALINDLHSSNVHGHMHRGFAVVGHNGLKTKECSFTSGEKRPICFVFPGVGSQWIGMGKDLLLIPTFANTIAECDTILKPLGVNIYKILKDDDPGLFDFLLNAFVGISAIQIALVNVLKLLGIKPDFIVGQSAGELACAYADGCFDVKETILAAYYRGLVSVETVIAPGAMAIIDTDADTLKEILPEGVEIACDNGPNNTVITGRKVAVQTFCQFLRKQSFFVKELPWCKGIPFHSSFLAAAKEKYCSYLKQLIPSPKKRSARWISSSVPESSWHTSQAKYCSAEYHSNNFQKCVCFREAFQKVPDSAIVLEIAPNGLMRSIMNSFGKKNLTIINMASKDAENQDNLHFFLSSIGRVYAAGAQPQVHKLYPPIQYPVSRGTKMLSPLVRWLHSRPFYVPKYVDESKNGVVYFEVSKTNDLIIDGHAYYPFSSCLVHVWKALARVYDRPMNTLPVVFRNVTVCKLITFNGTGKIIVDIDKETGYFKVSSEGNTAVSGSVELWEHPPAILERNGNPDFGKMALTSNELYKEFKLRGTQYGKNLQNINIISESLSIAEVEWNEDWSAMFESLIQFFMIQKGTRLVQVPSKLLELYVDPTKMTCSPKGKDFIASFNQGNHSASCCGIEMTFLEFSYSLPLKIYKEPTLEANTIVPYKNYEVSDPDDALLVCCQIAQENLLLSQSVNILEICQEGKPELLKSSMFHDFDNLQITIDHWILSEKKMRRSGKLKVMPPAKRHLVFCIKETLENIDYLSDLIVPGGFLIIKSDKKEDVSIPGLVECATQYGNGGQYSLHRKLPKKKALHVIDTYDEFDYKWVGEEPKFDEPTTLIFISIHPQSGIKGFVNCLLKQKIDARALLILDGDAPRFSLDDKTYLDQLSKGLVFNILKAGQWGCYRMLPLPKHNFTCQQAILSKSGKFLEGPHNRMIKLKKNEEVVDADFTAIRAYNFNVTGDLTRNFICEFSGRKKNGSKVMGLSIQPYGGTMSQVKLDKHLTWPVPKDWIQEEAAGSVAPYCMALIIFQKMGPIPNGQNFIITDCDTVLGFAVTSVALHLGHRVFGICSNSLTMQQTCLRLPQLEKHLFLDGDSSLLKAAKIKNRGGVDGIVHIGTNLNHQQLSCLRPGGTVFVANGQDSYVCIPTSAHLVECNVTNVLHYAKDSYVPAAFQKLLEAGAPAVRTTVVTQDEIATMDLNSCCIRAKSNSLVFKWCNDEEQSTQSGRQWEASPRVWYDPGLSYIVTGGLGGIGLEVCHFLIQRGARKLIISARSEYPKNGFQFYHLLQWKAKGINLQIVADDISTEEGVKKVITTAIKMAPVGGIFNLALSLTPIESLWCGVFNESHKSKRLSSIAFDYLSRKMCPQLQHFVLFSSLCSSRGVVSAAFYASSCASIDRISELRQADGFPSTSFQLGFVSGVGVAENINFTVPGTLAQNIASVVKVFDSLWTRSEPVVSTVLLETKDNDAEGSSTLLDAILKEMGLESAENIPSSSSLGSIGVDSMELTFLKAFLKQRLGLELTRSDIRNLTLAELSVMSKENLVEPRDLMTGLCKNYKIDKSAYLLRHYVTL